MPSVNFAPIFNGWQGFTPSGIPLAGGLVNTYLAGTSTPALTYTTSAGSIANSNPIVLDAGGRPPAEIWLIAGQGYKFILTDSLSNLLATYDNIVGIVNAPSSLWVASGLTPTFLNATQFSVVGNQVSLFPTGIRIQYTLTATQFYGTVTAASFAAGVTTVTVVTDSTPLTSALNTVNISTISPVNSALPVGYLPSFQAQRHTAWTFPTNPILFDAENFDIQSNYNVTTGIFTAPLSGVYSMFVMVTVQLTGAADTLYLKAGGISVTTDQLATGAVKTLTIASNITLAAGATVSVSATFATAWALLNPNGGSNTGAFFSMAKLP